MLSLLVDDIPGVVVDPSGPARGIAVWLPYLGGNKQEMEPALARLAEAGFAAASQSRRFWSRLLTLLMLKVAIFIVCLTLAVAELAPATKSPTSRSPRQ